MRIAQSELTAQSSWASIAVSQERIEARSWVTPGGVDPRSRRDTPPPGIARREPPPLLDAGTYTAPAHGTRGVHDEEAEELPTDARLELALTLLERLTGRRLRLLSAEDLRPKTDGPDVPDSQPPATAPERPPMEWGMVITHETTSYEAESATFSASGTVTTQDGRTISFAVDMSMSRERYEHSLTTIRAGAAAKAKDPLVISLDGRTVALTDARANIDLDADGTVDHVPVPAAGQAILAQDANGDGRVNDGREIVGALSGDGFADLAAADLDGNGWIDESDPIWIQLRLWQPGTGDDPGRLRTLLEGGIGAIAVGSVATPIKLEDSGGTAGALRSTGIALTEDGQARTISQIDVVA
jgi:hypothetical protein